MPRNKQGTIAARVAKLTHSRETLALMRIQNESILACARLSRDIDRQEIELAEAVKLERAMTPEQVAEREAQRQARIDKYQMQLAKARKDRRGDDGHDA